MMDIDYGSLSSLIQAGKVVPLVVNHKSTAGAGCPNCNDIQFVYGFRLAGGPFRTPLKAGDKWMVIDGKAGWYSGKMVEEPCPSCSQGRIQNWLASRCGLEGGDLQVMLSSFMAEGAYAKKAPARDLVGRLLGMGRFPSGFVTLYGNYGVGKSHLLKALVNGFRAQGVYAHYSTMNNLLETIKAKYVDKDGLLLVQTMIEGYQDLQVLCIDEFERFNPTPWNMDTSFRLLDSRFNNCENLLTVLASNIAPEEMTPDWGYLRSRILGGEYMQVPGPDMRPAVGAAERRDWE